MAVTLEEVVKQLSDSGIVSPATLENFVSPKSSPKSVEALVAELVNGSHLTEYQATEVAEGRAISLILGGYTIVNKIGAGGMGQVFKAQHRRMGRTVAIKLLPQSFSEDAAIVARFGREARVAAKLLHPNIVTAFDADEYNGSHFLVMEYVEGSDLSVLVKKNGPFPLSKSVNCILQAARGLEFAHANGVVHRDIKPANLLLGSDDVVKILDMGLARIEEEIGGQDRLTTADTVIGTYDYMSPEQAFSAMDADARADIYSLGCSLYFLIVGKAPYAGGSDLEKCIGHLEKPIPSLREALPDCPEQVEAIYRKMMAKKVTDRYQTMSEVIADLENCQSAASTMTTSTAPWKPSAIHESSDMSILMQNQKLKRISEDPFAVHEAPPSARREASGASNPTWKNSKVLIGAGAVGLALVLGLCALLSGHLGSEKTESKSPASAPSATK